MHIRMQGDISPKGAPHGNTPLKYEEIDGKYSCANPIGRKLLHHDIEKGHDRGPRGTTQEHQEAEDDGGAQERQA